MLCPKTSYKVESKKETEEEISKNDEGYNKFCLSRTNACPNITNTWRVITSQVSVDLYLSTYSRADGKRAHLLQNNDMPQIGLNYA